MSFEKVEEGDQQGGVSGSLTQFVSPDSGQVEEALSPCRFIERCGQSG